MESGGLILNILLPVRWYRSKQVKHNPLTLLPDYTNKKYLFLGFMITFQIKMLS